MSRPTGDSPPRMRGATASVAGSRGIVPKPTAGQHTYMLLGDGTWGAQPVAGLPSQTSNSGKLLTTDGTNAAWTTTGVLTSLTSPAATPLTLGTGTYGTALTVASATGNTSIASTTAGSSGAGALVVAGGLATGAASYFGGAIEAASLNLRAISNSPFDQSAWIRSTESDGVFFANLDASKYAGLKKDGTFATNGVISASGATFAGPVTVTGTTVLINAANPRLQLKDTTNSQDVWQIDISSDANQAFRVINQTSGYGQLINVSRIGAVQFNRYGAGTATFDSAGNITAVSDARLKNITGTFTKGLAEIVKLTPKIYTWKPESGLVTDDINATLIAQDLIAAGLSEAVTTYRTVPVMEDDVQSAEDIAAGKPVTQHPKLDADGKAVTQRVDSNYSVSDRTVIAALVNAVKALKAEIDALKIT